MQQFTIALISNTYSVYIIIYIDGRSLLHHEQNLQGDGGFRINYNEAPEVEARFSE